ncbi:hypothetical protein B0H14DRAFT_3522124 [Mycena olivaceomarginata]|nr:hypothetical protein B0H14DRAFT_3522124 [Mycena olivaceomarginata]
MPPNLGFLHHSPLYQQGFLFLHRHCVPPLVPMDELAALLAHIPEAFLSLYKEKSFPVGFRTKNPAFFVGTDWVDLGDLQTWLGGQDQFRHYLVGPVACV